MLAEDDACGAVGFGAVMGSKNLKAIAVQGTKKPEPADSAKLKRLSAFLRKIMKQHPFQIPSLPAGAKVNKQMCFGCIVGCDRYTIKAADGSKGKYMCASGPFYEAYAGRFYGELNEVPFIANSLLFALEPRQPYSMTSEIGGTVLRWLGTKKPQISSDERRVRQKTN